MITEVEAPPEPARIEAPRAPAPVELLLHPARFFQDRPGALTAGMTILVMAIIGVAGRIGSMDIGVLTGRGARQQSWTVYWWMVLAGALLNGPLRYLVGGAWCRLRLKWCGAGDVPPSRTRAISGLTDLIWAAPTVAAALLDTIRLPDPASSWAAGVSSAGEYSIVLCNLWSVWAVHSAVTRNVPLRPGPARFWFVILPAMFVLAMFGWSVYRGLSMAS